MLEQARPDIVVIASPPAIHRDITVAALEAGAHVLCEKPLAMAAEEGREMIAAAQRAKRTAMTSFNWRYIAAMQRLHTMAEAGFLGRVFHVNVRWMGARWADEEAPITWRTNAAPAGHGALGAMAIRATELIRWSFAEFKQLTSQSGIAYPRRTVPATTKIIDSEDFCTVTAELTTGAHVTLSTSRA